MASRVGDQQGKASDVLLREPGWCVGDAMKVLEARTRVELRRDAPWFWPGDDGRVGQLRARVCGMQFTQQFGASQA